MDGEIEKRLVSNLLGFMKDEKINMELQNVSDSEFWLEGSYGFLTVRFYIDEGAHEISYDVFSPKYDVHLKEETLKDVEKLDRIVEEKGKSNFEKSIEDLWLVLDCVKLWAQKNRCHVKEKQLI